MTNAAEMITEKDAAELARVSASTLARFAEAGYFQVETSGNDRFYSRRALAAVFGVSIDEAPVAASKENVIPFPQTSQRPVTEESQTPSVAETIPTPESVESLSSDGAPSAPSPEESTAAAPHSDAPATSSSEAAANLSQVLQMHADILSRQEREIQELRSERDWLRRRIEKLEEKAERDQVLLLSEAQTVKQLIQLQAQKKSTLRQALEWFGLVESANPAPEQKTYQSITATDSKNYASTDQNS